MKKLFAEFFGTFWIVLGGCGSAVFSAGIPDLEIDNIGVSLAFGLTMLTMYYGLGHISGAHFNPAVTLGLWAGGRFNEKDIIPYIVAQILGATVAATVIYTIGTGALGFSIDNTQPAAFGANGYGSLSPRGYGLIPALLTEFTMTFMFLLVFMGATDKRAPECFAGVAIGLTLTLIHLISIPVTNTSVNPARSISQSLFAGGEYIGQLWLFILTPIIGAMSAGFIYKAIFEEK